ncbi:MAG: aspartate/glutamate racemase family protein [Rhizomicrobium sp.]
MKTIGLIGGMTWDSTAIYYDLINREVQKRLGGLHSAKIAMISFDFAGPEEMARTSNWEALAALLTDAGRKLQSAGAELLVVCANTAHRVADRVERAVALPLVHVCDCTAASIKAAGLTRVSLLGTAYTMQEDFFKDRLRAGGLDVFVPDEADRAIIHRAINGVWLSGNAEPASRQACREVIARQIANGAEGVILGCTELPVLVKAEDSSVPLFDTTQIHALAAVEMAMA